MEIAVPVKAIAPVINAGGNGHKKFPANILFYLMHGKAPLERMEIARNILRFLSAAYTESRYKIIDAKWTDRFVIEKYARKIARLAEKNGEQFFVLSLLEMAMRWKKLEYAEWNKSELNILINMGYQTQKEEDENACMGTARMFAFFMELEIAKRTAERALELIMRYKKSGTV